MPASRLVFSLLVAALFLGGLSQVLHRHFTLGIPLLPSTSRAVWFVDAKINFKAQGEAISVSLALPESQPGFTILAENLVSPGYGVSLIPAAPERRAQWTIAKADGEQNLYYKLQLAADNNIINPAEFLPPQAADPSVFLKDADKAAAEDLLAQARRKSADPLSFARRLFEILTSTTPSQTVTMLETSYDREALFVTLLAQENIIARTVSGLELQDGRRRQRLRDYVQVFDGGKWNLFDLRNGIEGRLKNVMLWTPGASSILEVVGGEESDLSFSILLQEENAVSSVLSQLTDMGQDDFSIYRLPLEEQALLKGMFLIPIGALVVVFMRVIVGIRTSGTFMPVLLAVAFIQTELIPGLISFLLIVGTGLFVRNYLSRINLLLVPRISATIIVVIGLVILFTLLSERMGLDDIQNFAFFPLVIMSWTIERMSILWEEEGPKEVMIQGAGSLLVAVLAYLLMATPLIRHLSFNFLGLQAIFLALILMMGRYTGYRLTELARFTSLTESK